MEYSQWTGTLVSTAVRAVLVAKLVILEVLFLTSFILPLKAAVVTKSVIVGISILPLFISSLRVVLVSKLMMSDILSSYSWS